MAESDHLKFQQLIEPHLGAAYNLARWITGNEAEASDVLQDSSLRAFRFIHQLKSENSRAWFFQIVRNTVYTSIKNRKAYAEIDSDIPVKDPTPNAEDLLSQEVSSKELSDALNALPLYYREVLILRELEEMSYEEIATIIQAPAGTVMSRLARARNALKKILNAKGESK